MKSFTTLSLLIYLLITLPCSSSTLTETHYQMGGFIKANAHFDGLKYYWRMDVKNLRVAEEAFDRVDEIRKPDLNLGPYGTNEKVFK